MSIEESPHSEYDRGFSNGWEAARAQPAITSESGNQAAQGASAITRESAQAGALLTDEECLKAIAPETWAHIEGIWKERALHDARAIESLVRSKLGAGVPMTPLEHAAALDEAVDDGCVDEVDMWAFIHGIKVAEKFHGIVGKEGGNV